MATSSGSLSGDDGGQQFDNLNNSIRENSEKLAAIAKLLSGGGDTPNAQRMLSQSKEVFSTENAKFAKDFALKQQAQLDRLSSNNFRATETIISELLSRFGGTSFYPALSAFRVARESVAVGTGKTQSELNVMDIIKFVNDSSKELMTDIFKSLGEKIGFLKTPTDDLSKAMEDLDNILKETATTANNANKEQEKAKPTFSTIKEFIQSITKEFFKPLVKNTSTNDLNKTVQDTLDTTAKSIEEAISNIDISKLQEETMPTLFEYSKALEKISAEGGLQKATIDELNKALILIETSDELAVKFAETAENIKNALKSLGEPEIPFVLASEKEKNKFKKTATTETEAFNTAKNAAINEIKKSEITPEAMKAAKTAAGIAGLGVTALTLMSSFKQLSQIVLQTGVALKNSITNTILNPQGTSTGTSALQPLAIAAGGLPDLGNLIGTSIGTYLGGPVGGVIGSTLGSIVGSTIALPIQAAVDILTSIEDGINQVRDSLVGFSTDVTLAVIDRDLKLINDDIRRSNQIGYEVGRLTEAQTGLQLASRRAFDNLVEITEPILTTMTNLLTLILNATAGNKFVLESIISAITGGVGGIILNGFKVLASGLDLIADLLREEEGDLSFVDDIVNVRPDADWFKANFPNRKIK